MSKGFIVIGYQGIGKSTLANSSVGKYIDLESGNFFVNNERPLNWEIIYANIAKSLVEQGYIVFLSSHATVRQAVKNCGCDFGVIFPDIALKDAWILKLKNRFFKTEKDKDFKAWQNAKSVYEDNIRELMEFSENTGIINNMDYNLETLVEALKKKIEENKDLNGEILMEEKNENKKKLQKTIVLSDKDAMDVVLATCYTPASDDDIVMEEDDTFTFTATFSDGKQIDVKVCGSDFDEGEPWTEAVLFTKEGAEICCTEPEEDLFGEWTLETDDIIYKVLVEAEHPEKVEKWEKVLASLPEGTSQTEAIEAMLRVANI